MIALQSKIHQKLEGQELARSCLSVFAFSFSEAVIEAMVTGIRCGANKSPSTPDTGNRKTKKPAYLLALIVGPDWSVREDSNLRPLAPRTYSEKKPASILVKINGTAWLTWQ